MLGLAGCAGLPGSLTPEAQMDRGIHLFEQGDYDAAVRDLGAALEQDPSLTRAYVYLFRAELERERWREALDVLARALEWLSGPGGRAYLEDMVNAIIAFALGLLDKGKPGKAVTVLAGALDRMPESRAVADARVEALLAYGASLLSQGEWRRAIEQYSHVIDQAPSSLDRHIAGYLGLARALISGGELRRALEAIRNALRLSPQDAGASELLKQLLER